MAKTQAGNPVGYLNQCGIDLVESAGGQLMGDCPFCTAHKFFVNPTTGQWDCKGGDCLRSGNKYTFLADYWEMKQGQNDRNQLEKLSLAKNIPISALEAIGVVSTEPLQQGEDRYLIPIRLMKKSGPTIVNLLHYSSKTNKAYATEGCNLYFLGADTLSPEKSRPVYICEGVWDYAAWKYIQTINKIDADCLGSLGATVIDKVTAPQLQGREVIILYDADAAGQKGAMKLARYLLGEVDAKIVRVLGWPEGTPNKFDIRDVFHSARSRTLKIGKESDDD